MRLWPDLTILRAIRKLRRLQRQYYKNQSKDIGAIVEYMALLEQTREYWSSRNAPSNAGVKLHLGAGDHRIAGWVNIDTEFNEHIDLRSDLTDVFPFRDASVDFIHSEDFLEHISLDAGRAVLRECHRVLKPGGVLRILTPDLAALARKVYIREESLHLEWCKAQLGAVGPCEAFNMHLRMEGEHRFIYDEPLLMTLLEDCGFRPRRVGWNWSKEPALRFLDLRDFGLNLFLEGVKVYSTSDR